MPVSRRIDVIWTRDESEPVCAVIHFYFQLNCFTKATVSLSALLSGLLLMVGLMLYPAGWGSMKVIYFCGPEASPFRPDQCSLGWAFYAAIGGTLATFLCSVLSAQAEIATSSDKVQEEIEEGKNLICLFWISRNHLKWRFMDVHNWTS